jgi:hypothetical protein
MTGAVAEAVLERQVAEQAVQRARLDLRDRSRESRSWRDARAQSFPETRRSPAGRRAQRDAQLGLFVQQHGQQANDGRGLAGAGAAAPHRARTVHGRRDRDELPVGPAVGRRGSEAEALQRARERVRGRRRRRAEALAQESEQLLLGPPVAQLIQPVLLVEHQRLHAGARSAEPRGLELRTPRRDGRERRCRPRAGVDRLSGPVGQRDADVALLAFLAQQRDGCPQQVGVAARRERREGVAEQACERVAVLQRSFVHARLPAAGSDAQRSIARTRSAVGWSKNMPVTAPAEAPRRNA